MNYLLLVWNVYNFNLNSHVIKPFNIFCHNKFKKDVVNNLKECDNKDEFAEKLKSNLRYYFGQSVSGRYISTGLITMNSKSMFMTK